MLCRLVAIVSPRQRSGGLIQLYQYRDLPRCCLVRGSTLLLVGWGFRLLLWPWGAGCAAESPPEYLGLEPWVSHPALGELREAAWCLEGEESWVHRKGGVQLGMG